MSDKTNILVVDDEEVVRLSHTRLLSGDRCAVQAVWNGSEALRAMEAKPFDVVLLDLRMPGMDGMTVLRSIKQRWPQSQVIVVTGYPSLETAKEAIRYGAYDYLAKPVEPEQIVNAAHRAALLKRWAIVREESQDDAVRAAACTTH